MNVHSPSDQFLGAAASARTHPAVTNQHPIGRVPMVILALLVSTVGVLNYFWLSQNTVPPHWDAANHMTSALTFHGVLSQCFSQSHFALPGLRHCLGELVAVNQGVYPPLFSFAGGLFIFLAGSSITALAMTNVPFIALLVVATYLMGRTIHSRLAGVLAALLIVAYPLVFQMSHEFMLEFAMLAIAAAASCFLLLSDRFSKTGMTVLFGLTMGLGALTKITLLTYLIGPATCGVRAPADRRRPAPRRCVRGGAATVDARGRARTRSRRRGPVVLAEPSGFPE